MLTPSRQAAAWAAAFATLLGLVDAAVTASSEAHQARVEAALANITTLQRPGQDGLATVWDGNKYVQCRRRLDQALRCEAAGTLMQPSLGHVLMPERVVRLEALGWQLDPSFGNYAQTFPADLSAKETAARILLVLVEGYDADLANLEVQSDWIKSVPCPPRNGPSQNLAGMINDDPAMTAVVVRGCFYKPRPNEAPPRQAYTSADLIDLYGTRVSGEIQRLRVNIDRQKFVDVVLKIGGGYVQCGTQPPGAIYCEAQSAESWPVLARILTPERVARLHATGYADPGRSPNYWKSYSINELSDRAIGEELLTILFDVYAYNGVPTLEFNTERD